MWFPKSYHCREFEVLPNIRATALRNNGCEDAVNFANRQIGTLMVLKPMKVTSLRLMLLTICPAMKTRCQRKYARLKGLNGFRELRPAVPGNRRLIIISACPTPVPLRDVLTLRGQSGVEMTMATNQPAFRSTRSGISPGKATI